MDLLTTLHRSGGIVALSRQLGIEPQAAAALAEPLLPIITAAFRGIEAQSGIDGLLAFLQAQGGVSLAAEIMGFDPVDLARGVSMLARLHIDANSLAGVAQASDQDRGDLARMLPLLAMLAAGYLAGIELSRPDSHAVLADLLADGPGPVATPGRN